MSFKKDQHVVTDDGREAIVISSTDARTRVTWIDDGSDEVVPTGRLLDYKTEYARDPVKNPKLMEALVRKAHQIKQGWGMESLANYQDMPQMCGCVGPQDGEPFCPCTMNSLLASNLVRVINEIDPDVALRVMRKRIVAALG